MLCIPVTDTGIGFVGCSLCGVDFGILCRLSCVVGRFSDEPAHIRNRAIQAGDFLRNGLTRVLCVPVADNCSVRVSFGSIRGGFVFKAGGTLTDSLVRVVGFPVPDIGIRLIGSSLCGVDFGILRGLFCRVGRGINFVVCDVSNLFHVCRDSIATTVQGSISVGACKLFLLHFLRNGRVGENVVPVRCIAFKAGKAGSMLCDFCRVVRNVFRVFADIGVLNGLFGFQGINVGLVGDDTVTQRGICCLISRVKLRNSLLAVGGLLRDGSSVCGIPGFTCLRFGSVCRLIGRVKLRNSLLAVGGLFGDSSGVCLLCGLCAVDFGVQAGGQVGNVGFDSVKAFAQCRHFGLPLLHLFVPAVDKVGKLLVIFLELLNQSGQVKHGFLQVSELPVIVGRFDPIFRLAFRVRGQLCTLRHIALRRVTVAVVGHNGQRFILALVVPLHGVCENRDVPRTDVHTRAALERGRGTRVRMRGASVRVAAVTARRVGCTGNGKIIAVTVCHNRMLLS